MKKILLAVMAVAVLASYAPARETGTRLPLPQNPRAEIDRELCRLQEQTMDLDARHWARRIANGEFSYEELNGYSRKWAGDPKCNQRLMQRIRQNLDTGNTAALSEEEQARLEQTRQASRAALMPALRDKELIDSLTAQQCIALDGQYWAWRVKRVGDITLKELEKHAAETWPCPQAYNQQIIAEVKKNIRSHQTAPLSTRQAYMHDACTQYDCSAYQEPKKK